MICRGIENIRKRCGIGSCRISGKSSAEGIALVRAIELATQSRGLQTPAPPQRCSHCRGKDYFHPLGKFFFTDIEGLTDLLSSRLRLRHLLQTQLMDELLPQLKLFDFAAGRHGILRHELEVLGNFIAADI